MIDNNVPDIKPPPGAPGWVTPELLQDTLDTWQPRYHERLTVNDALDILLAVSRLVDAIHRTTAYGNGFMTCGHCGRPIVCETKHKGGREYQYYRCINYHKGDHPRERTIGTELDKHMLALFDRLKIEDRQPLQWLQRVIRAKAKAEAEVEDNTAQLHDINHQMGQINKDRDALLTLRIHEEIESETYAQKDGKLRNRMKRLKMRLDGQEKQKTEIGDTAMKVFELSQNTKNKRVKADIAEKRLIIGIVCLNLTLKDASLEISMRKPFDAIVEGLNLKIGTEERT